MKRNFCENPANRRFKWWFTLHGDESLLNVLKSKWPLVYSQTMWNLNPVSNPTYPFSNQVIVSPFYWCC